MRFVALLLFATGCPQTGCPAGTSVDATYTIADEDAATLDADGSGTVDVDECAPACEAHGYVTVTTCAIVPGGDTAGGTGLACSGTPGTC